MGDRGDEGDSGYLANLGSAAGADRWDADRGNPDRRDVDRRREADRWADRLDVTERSESYRSEADPWAAGWSGRASSDADRSTGGYSDTGYSDTGRSHPGSSDVSTGWPDLGWSPAGWSDVARSDAARSDGRAGAASSYTGAADTGWSDAPWSGSGRSDAGRSDRADTAYSDSGYPDTAYSDSSYSDSSYSDSDYSESGYSETSYSDAGRYWSDLGWSAASWSRGGRSGAGSSYSGAADVARSDAGPSDRADSGYSDTGYSDTNYSGTGYSGPGYSGTGYSGTGYSGTDHSETGYSDAGRYWSDLGWSGSSYSGAADAARSDAGPSDRADSGYSGAGYSDAGRGWSDPGWSGDAGWSDVNRSTAARREAPLDALAPESTDEAAAGVARRLQARLDRHLWLLEQLQGQQLHPTPPALPELQDTALRMRRDSESLLLLCGQEPEVRTAGPRPLEELLADVAAAAEQPRRVDVRPVPAALVAATAATEFEYVLAELVDHVTAVYPAADVELASRLESPADPAADGRGATVEVVVEGAVRYDPDGPGERAVAAAQQLAQRSRHGIVLRHPSGGVPTTAPGPVASVHCPPAVVTPKEPERAPVERDTSSRVNGTDLAHRNGSREPATVLDVGGRRDVVRPTLAFDESADHLSLAWPEPPAPPQALPTPYLSPSSSTLPVSVPEPAPPEPAPPESSLSDWSPSGWSLSDWSPSGRSLSESSLSESSLSESSLSESSLSESSPSESSLSGWSLSESSLSESSPSESSLAESYSSESYSSESSGSSDVDELFGPLINLPLEPIDDRYSTPIFEAVASAWFQEGGPDSGGGEPGFEYRDPSGPGDPLDWETPHDDEWREAAARAARPEPTPTTATGLPVRQPGSQLVPPPRSTESQSHGPGDRVPDRVRDRLTTYQRGLQEGRHRSGSDGAEPENW